MNDPSMLFKTKTFLTPGKGVSKSIVLNNMSNHPRGVVQLAKCHPEG